MSKDSHCCPHARGSRWSLGSVREKMLLPERLGTVGPEASADPRVFSGTVVGRLTGIGPQTLYLYERRGLLLPTHTAAGRRYSRQDVVTARRIQRLIDAGANLSAVARILELEDEQIRLRCRHPRALAGRIRGAGSRRPPSNRSDS